MFNNQYMIDNLTRQKDRIDEMIKNCQSTATPINNFINTNQTSMENIVEWRILNENEEVDNLYVKNKTLFISDNMMVLKSVDGKLEKWEIKKIYPIDKKDEKINQLEQEIKNLKEMIKNEHTELNSTNEECNRPDINVDEYVDRKSKTTSKSISK